MYSFLEKTFSKYTDLAWSLEILPIIKRYEESHRHYHTLEHLEEVVRYILEKCTTSPAIYSREELLHAALYHDAVYDPRSKSNEKDSALLYLNTVCVSRQKDKVRSLILSTESGDVKEKTVSHKLLLEADRAILSQSFSDLVEYEHNIFKEFSFVPYSEYKRHRIAFLLREAERYSSTPTEENLKELAKYVENRKIKVGVFCGSFDPFHIGHLSILKEAGRLFDKVIVGQGKNETKDTQKNSSVLSEKLPYHQVENYSSLLFDFLKEDCVCFDSSEVTLIRGLRNASDLQYEFDLVKKLKHGLTGDPTGELPFGIAYLAGDVNLSHMSSSFVRGLASSGYNIDKYIL